MRNLATLISKCGRDTNHQLGAALHAMAVKRCTGRPILDEWNALISMYSKWGQLSSAVKVFDEMPLKDSFTWNSLLLGCLVKREFGFAFGWFTQMHGLKPCPCDRATITTIVACCAEMEVLSTCAMVHGVVAKYGLGFEVAVGNALITSYFQCGCFNSARKVFNEMPERNIITWTSMVSGLAKGNLFRESIGLFNDMRTHVKANNVTYSSALTVCSRSKALKEGRQIHGLILKSGLFTPNLRVISALMDMYSKCGLMKDALHVFKSCKEIDHISVTIILTGFAQNEMEREAFEFFAKLVNLGIEIDPNMVSAVFGAFGTAAPLYFGRQIHAMAVKKRFLSSTHVCNGLINMYLKSGEFTDAFKVFYRIKNKNLVSWNSMILASARHGNTSQVFDLYKSMKNEGIEPTDVTFLSLLQACSHTGSHKMALEVLNSMFSSKVQPRIDHYACIVDMLGRAGFLNDAKRFVERLDYGPKMILWQTLLGACKIHGNIEIGEYAAEQLVNEAPDSVTGYVLLGNIYSAEGRWVERGKIGKKMRSLRVQKDIGMSWIEIGKRTRVFAAADCLNCPGNEMITEVIAQLIAIGNDRMIMMDTDLLGYNFQYEMSLLL